MKFYSVDALAGVGKTTAAVNFALEQTQLGRKVAIVQLTTHLIDQTYDLLKNKGVIVNKFHTKYNAGPVKQLVHEHLTETFQATGEILFLTHQTFLTMPHWHRPEDWDIIIDEIPQVHVEWLARLPENYSLFTDLIDVGTNNNDYAEISIKKNCTGAMTGLAENRYRDDVSNIYMDVAAKLLASDVWDTYIHMQSYDETINELNKATSNLHTHSMLKPEPFAKYNSFTVMGAMFTESVMYKVWSTKVTFTPHPEITAGLKSSHDNGALLTIKYLFEQNWTKGLRDSVVDGKRLLTAVKEVVQHEFLQKDFIYASNKDDTTNMRTGVRLSTHSHGINDYRHIDRAAFMSALNANNPTYKFMKTQNVSPQEVAEAQMLQTMYQFVMRTSLRMVLDKSYKTVIVMDRRSADYLQGYFAGSTIEKIADLAVPPPKKVGRPPTGKTMTDAERMRAYRAKKKEQS